MTEFLVEEHKGAIAIGVTITWTAKSKKQQQINVMANYKERLEK